MKKIIHPRNLPLLVMIGSILGLLLRYWTLGSGPNQNGLYEKQPVAWVLLWIVTALVLGLTFLLSRPLKNPGEYSDNFPASVLGAIGTGLAAVGVLYAGMQSILSISDLLDILGGVLGLASGVLLILAAVCRFKGKKAPFVCYTVTCLFFALRVFNQCQLWSNEPQISTFIFPFIASLCIMLAAYQRACFDVDLGKRSAYIFWALLAVYFSVLSLPSLRNLLFYGTMAAWLLINLCSLRPLKKRKDTPEAEPAPAEEIPAAAEEAPAPQPEAEEAAPAEDATVQELKDWLDQH